MDKNTKKAKYERLYANALMYLAKGETRLAEKYLNESAVQLKEYAMTLHDSEKAEAREWLLELCGHIKTLAQSHAAEGQKVESVSQESKTFAFSHNDIPAVSFSDVIGLEDVKLQIYDKIIYPRRYAELYARFHKKVGGGILLYGPPGNGKTMIAKAIAHETGSSFYPIKFSDLGSKWFGETEGRIRNLFEEARRAESAVIFFDEIDAIASKRSDSSATDRMVAELLTQIDGINKGSGNLTILAATNRLENIDEAILRPGRFDEKIYIPLPDTRSRAAMFEKKLEGIPADVSDFSALAALCEGFSGAEIELACEKAKQTVIRAIINGASADTHITAEDVQKAITLIRAS